MANSETSTGRVTVADVDITKVRPRSHGFALDGQGRDGADYHLELRLDVPMDRKTQVILGEMLAQSTWTVTRLVRQSLRAGAKGVPRRPRARPGKA